MIRRLICLLLLLVAAPAAAQQPTFASTFLEGSWALRLDGSIVMRFDLELTGGTWAGGWVKPTSFRSDGARFGNIVMPAVERRADSGRAIGDWAEITFDDPRPGEEDDQFRFRLIGPDRAEMLYVGTGFAPFTLERVAAGAPLGPFEAGAVYDDRPNTPRPVATRPSVQPTPTPTPTNQPPAQGPADNRPPAMTGR